MSDELANQWIRERTDKDREYLRSFLGPMCWKCKHSLLIPVEDCICKCHHMIFRQFRVSGDL